MLEFQRKLKTTNVAGFRQSIVNDFLFMYVNGVRLTSNINLSLMFGSKVRKEMEKEQI